MQEEGNRYIYQAPEAKKFNDELIRKGIFQQAGEVFAFGVSVALAVNPDIKISKSLKENIKRPKGSNVGQILTLDSTGQLVAMIAALEKEPSENYQIRFEELGNWGLLEIKKNFLDADGYINWDKIKKSI